MLAEQIIRTYYVPDWEAIGAIGTMLAVFVAVGWEPLRKWWNAPTVRLVGPRPMEAYFQQKIEKTYNLRSFRLIAVNTGNESAQRVEITLTDLFQINETTGTYHGVAGFVATPLVWTHSTTSVCEFLPGGARKLCEFGVHQRSEPPADDDIFTLSTAVQPKLGYNHLTKGLYVARVVASAVNCKASTLVISMRIGGPTPVIIRNANAAVLREISRIDRSLRLVDAA